MKNLSDVSEQQKRDQMAAAAVSNVFNEEMIERKLRQLQPAKDISGLHVIKQITLPPPAPTPFIFSFCSHFRCLFPPFVLLQSLVLLLLFKFIAHSVLN